MKLLNHFLNYLKLVWSANDGVAWFIPMLAMAAAGVAKNEFIDKPAAKRQGAAQANMTKWSPWTGMKGKTIEPPSSANAAMKWGTTGAMMGLQYGDKMSGGAAAKSAPPSGSTSAAYNYQPQQNSWSQMGQGGGRGLYS